MDLYNYLASDDGLAVQIGLSVSLLLGGIGFPIPEDLPIILGGVAVSKGIVDVRSVFLICYLCVVLSDQLLYLLGYLFGPKILRVCDKSEKLWFIDQKKIFRSREHLIKHSWTYIFLARHIFPIRTVTFITAGALKIPFVGFLITDCIAAFVSVSLVLGIGYFLGQRLSDELITEIVDRWHYYLLLILSVVAAFAVIKFLPKIKKNYTAEEALNEKTN